ncbi:hypothetical protein A2615_04870 [Candidatus Curtissbacteria bacterium RIFOXYD1_FULL_41_36]|nr:MAG: hypothetical protein A2615_04870 [Candidatus Curtissbacteria bacterium RIFOXYD1_FULL_41_36]OGE12895.1 MAG: hypothetical protein A2305_02525 [Candidatus Curtissbacteria bacterium RIFOXYB2_FULL_41_10]
MRSSEFTINNFQFTINFRGLRALGIVLTSLHERADISWGRKYVFVLAFIRGLIVHGILRANINFQ